MTYKCKCDKIFDKVKELILHLWRCQPNEQFLPIKKWRVVDSNNLKGDKNDG
jgi:hypothetical protein